MKQRSAHAWVSDITARHVGDLHENDIEKTCGSTRTRGAPRLGAVESRGSAHVIGSQLIRAIEELLHVGVRRIEALLGPSEVGEETLVNPPFLASTRFAAPARRSTTPRSPTSAEMLSSTNDCELSFEIKIGAVFDRTSPSRPAAPPVQPRRQTGQREISTPPRPSSSRAVDGDDHSRTSVHGVKIPTKSDFTPSPKARRWERPIDDRRAIVRLARWKRRRRTRSPYRSSLGGASYPAGHPVGRILLP